jgi:hypothetical protein
MDLDLTPVLEAVAKRLKRKRKHFKGAQDLLRSVVALATLLESQKTRVASSASKDVFKPRERVRMKTVTDALSSGSNPYEEFSKGSHGPAKFRELELEVFHQELSEDRQQILRDKWNKREEGKIKISKGPNLKALGIPAEPNTLIPLPEGAIRCSFCGKPTYHIQATVGMGPALKFRDYSIVETPTGPRLEEEIRHSSQKMTACPDCALKIKPITKKNADTGQRELVSSNIRFHSEEDYASRIPSTLKPVAPADSGKVSPVKTISWSTKIAD